MAAAIESGSLKSADNSAALIAEHLQAAGDRRAAYAWHMRAATWSTHRDIAAARVSWERARQIAERLPDDDPDRTAMRIAPRAMLCGAGWRVDAHIAGHFDANCPTCRCDRCALRDALPSSNISWRNGGHRVGSSSPMDIVARVGPDGVGSAALQSCPVSGPVLLSSDSEPRLSRASALLHPGSTEVNTAVQHNGVEHAHDDAAAQCSSGTGNTVLASSREIGTMVANSAAWRPRRDHGVHFDGEIHHRAALIA